MDPGFKAQAGTIDAKSKSAFDGKLFCSEDDEELEHEYGALAMMSDKAGNQGSEFYVFLEQGNTVCAAQMDSKHQVIGRMVGGKQTIKKIEQLMHDNYHSSRDANVQHSLGGKPVQTADGKDPIVIVRAGECDWSAADAAAEQEAEYRQNRRDSYDNMERHSQSTFQAGGAAYTLNGKSSFGKGPKGKSMAGAGFKMGGVKRSTFEAKSTAVVMRR